jgi:hypothetical protein
MELFLTDGGPVFGEIAARPPGGYLMDLMGRAYGFDPWEKLIRLALGETPAFPARADRYAGVWVLHPGAGTVGKIRGLTKARAVPGVRKVVCTLGPGDVVKERLGSGDSKGRIVVEGATNEECAEALRQAVALITVSFLAPDGPAGGEAGSARGG